MNTEKDIKLSDDINIGLLFRLIMMQSKLIVLIILVITGLSLADYLTKTKTHQVTSLVQIYSKQQQAFGQNMALDLYTGNSNTSDMRNIEDLYKSRSNMLKIIEESKTNIKIEGLNFVEKYSLINGIKAENQTKGLKKFIVSLDKDGYLISVDNKATSKKINYNQKFNFNGLEIDLNKTNLIGDYHVQFTHPENLFRGIKSKFNVTSTIPSRASYQTSGLVTVKYKSSDIDEAVFILDYANELFIKGNIESESEQARKAIDFIDLQIFEVKKSLDFSKDQLKNFRQINKSVNVDREIEIIVENLSELEAKINQIDIEISTAGNDYTQTNPIYLNLLGQKSVLIEQRQEIEEKIKQLPLAQQQYIDLFRDVEITEQAYQQLANKKLEFSIKEASTLGNIRVVDNAYYDFVVNPTLSQLIIAFIAAVITSLVIAVVRGIYFLAISNPAELLDNNITIPIIGVVPKTGASDTEERLKNSLESLVVNLDTLDKRNEPKKIITITSATPSNGKSFVSLELARKLASLDNKVLLLDFDFKRGDLNKNFGMEKVKLDDFLEIDENTLEKNFKVNNNLYFIPKLSRLENSFQFLYTSKFNDVFESITKGFDYVVVDTAPLLSVADTSILLTMADIKLAICRHGVSKINELKQLISISDQVGEGFDGIIYNAYEKPNSYYGYYGFYGNYNYQYYAQKYLYDSYDYKDAKD